MRGFLLSIGGLLILAGCRTEPYVNAHIDTVNAEYRQLEDYVYSLEAENARLTQELEFERTRSGSAAASGQPPTTRGVPRRTVPSPIPRRSTSPGPSTPDVETPTIEMPGTTPSGSRSSTLNRPALDRFPDTSPADTPPNIEPPALRRLPEITPPATETLPIPGTARPTSHEAISTKPTDTKITHLHINPQTGGANFDGQPGDDGVRLAIEPRNAAEECVAQAGALSVVLLDPEREGDAARVARWDFDQKATKQLLANSSSKSGIEVELSWPNGPPTADRLKLFVRYEMPDGRRLQADREIFIRSPGQAVTRWTPRPGVQSGSTGGKSADIP